jgi:hypothetical protein
LRKLENVPISITIANENIKMATSASIKENPLLNEIWDLGLGIGDWGFFLLLFIEKN